MIDQIMPCEFDDPAVFIQLHLPLHDLTEQTRPVLGDDGDEVRPGPGVIVPLQADGAAVMAARRGLAGAQWPPFGAQWLAFGAQRPPFWAQRRCARTRIAHRPLPFKNRSASCTRILPPPKGAFQNWGLRHWWFSLPCLSLPWIKNLPSTECGRLAQAVKICYDCSNAYTPRLRRHHRRAASHRHAHGLRS
ncbi:hypothetical protein SE15_13615 [Thermanaerothrix daxensis]|uniref:Uncharacterized protein n=2 Tax=Thermanaerothrix daxensis TaxID=869279 RepID=A0A0P6XSM3_9CHLR|nr:hypothetical protein SE15_13615 [Thermanaerothrix daxensis]